MRGDDAGLDLSTVTNRRVLLQLAGATAGGAALAACGSSGNALAAGITASTTTFRSAARRGQQETYQVLLPPGAKSADGLPVCLVLHGRGDNHRAAVRVVHLDRALATIAQQGAPPIALVAMDGGDHTYWHRRSDGDDPQRMLTDELLPRLAATGMRTARIALFGWSMGGYGSLLLAETLGRSRVAFVAVDSPALWQQPGESAPGAFDDRDDFLRNDVFASRSKLAGIPVRVMSGKSDPFLTATLAFVEGVPDLVAADFPAGKHNGAFWTSTGVSQLAPLARALA
jgi:S-formylglutathione hydrolase FrmB